MLTATTKNAHIGRSSLNKLLALMSAIR
ncbi:hypothetical protein Rhein_3230, partial [Rheinheimera sp. A13L]